PCRKWQIFIAGCSHFFHAAFAENEKVLLGASELISSIVSDNPPHKSSFFAALLELARETEIFAALFATVHPYFDSAGNAQCTCASSKDDTLLQREKVEVYTTRANAELEALNQVSNSSAADGTKSKPRLEPLPPRDWKWKPARNTCAAAAMPIRPPTKPSGKS
ncbi:MAG: hypothetical protein LBI39_00400, partial [Puniceicoccales bacterium]|nr:hypothetical protein [Puniceicoccales bacterium]